MASKGHFLTQIPHPMQRSSDIHAILDNGATSMHSLPERKGGVMKNKKVKRRSVIFIY